MTAPSPVPAGSAKSHLTGVGQIAIRVHDVERALKFYRDGLGLRFLFQFPGLAFFACGEVRLMLALPERPEDDHAASVIYFTVDNLDATFVTLTAAGVEFTNAPHIVHRAQDYDLWMGFLKDPDGNTLGLMEERRHGTPNS